ncbi:MAG: hypothetical protein IJT30_08105 [Muribaculaceae bacterium]|nr:hypothetical protein [Muribaculaceae bacterium]
MYEYQDIKNLLKPQRTIGASAQLRQRIDEASVNKRAGSGRTVWRRTGAAAACAAMVMGATMLFNNRLSRSANESACIVYVAGKQASDNEAKTIAEADVAKMEQFMQTVAQQNAIEQEKVNQFMQHKPSQQ